MASRKEQKEAARARRLAEEQARAEKARRDRRLRMLGGLVIITVAVIGVVIAISSGSGGGLKTGKAATATAKTVQAELAGIPQSGRTLGNPKAPVTMTYFGDLECPVCQAFTLGQEGGGLPQLLANEVKDGKVKVVYRSFCTATCNGPGQAVFNTQQSAAYAAGEQNKFWDFAELFYREQGEEDTGYVNSHYLDGLAGQVPGLNISQWKSASSENSLTTQVASDETDATSLGVTGTPTVFVQGPKGKVQASGSIPSYSSLQQAISQVS